MIRYILISLSVPLLTTGVLIPGVPATPALSGAVGVPANPVPDASTPLAPELSGLGTWQFPVSTKVARAQLFFNQGLRLLYGFNHPESLRAFREAARLDPALAMAYWGQAIALGPNLNAPLTPENAAAALAAIDKARSLAKSAAPIERALIEAQARRFTADGADRKSLDLAYADAMRGVADAFNDHADVQTLFADALMNTMPWDYWQKDGGPKPDTSIALTALERVLARHPGHPGANHYHIHLLEASNDPDRAVASADRLGALMPAAGHMVHMPSHIYLRVGRYAEAGEANERAIVADEDYLAQCQAQGLYPISYYPHNVHFLWAAATFEGRSAVAIAAARKVAEKVPHHHAGAVVWTADFPVTPLLSFARFGRWTEVLTSPEPPAHDPYARGLWHYARAMAYTARGQQDRAQAEVARVETLIGHEAFTTKFKDTPFAQILTIAARMAAGEMAARDGRFEDAIAKLQEAVAIEDGLPYNEPPFWHHPPRQVLGAVLLDAGRASDAERVYREDLVRFRENGWSLFGLARSLEAQGKKAEAADADRRFRKAWARADITLTSSRIMPRRSAAGMSPTSSASKNEPREP